MDRDAYVRWLREQWSPELLAGIVESRGRRRGHHLYTGEAMALLVATYSRLDGWTRCAGESLADLLSTILLPYFPPIPGKIGIFFRDWPIPCEDAGGFAPEERGQARVPENIMAGAIERVIAPGGTRYATLRRGFLAAHAVVRHYRDDDLAGWEPFVRGCVVSDLVKLQAPFRAIDGSAFTAALSKRSCHSWGMYEFAGELFGEELDCLELDFVVGFGARSPWAAALRALQNRGWQVHTPTDGTGRWLGDPLPEPPLRARTFILLPHPQARGHALTKAVRLLTDAEIQLPPAPIPPDEDEEIVDGPPSRPPPGDEFYARIEIWLEDRFGGWAVEPHHRKGYRSFRPEGRLSGAICGTTTRGRSLVFHCANRERWIGGVPGHRIKAGDGRRIQVYIPDDGDLLALEPLIEDWE